MEKKPQISLNSLFNFRMEDKLLNLLMSLISHAEPKSRKPLSYIYF